MVVELRIKSNHGNIIAWTKGVSMKTIPGAANAITKRMAEDIRFYAQENIYDRTKYQQTGRLVRSIVVRNLSNKNKPSFQIIAGAPYAIYTEEGTKPHYVQNPLGIYWKTKTFGHHWRDTGGWYLHPGAEPMYFMRDAISEVLSRWSKYVDESFKIDAG